MQLVLKIVYKFSAYSYSDLKWLKRLWTGTHGHKYSVERRLILLSAKETVNTTGFFKNVIGHITSKLLLLMFFSNHGSYLILLLPVYESGAYMFT